MQITIEARTVRKANSNTQGHEQTPHTGATTRRCNRMLSVVVAASKEWGIGKDGGIPWRLPGDMAYFREVTMATTDPDKQNAVRFPAVKCRLAAPTRHLWVLRDGI